MASVLRSPARLLLSSLALRASRRYWCSSSAPCLDHRLVSARDRLDRRAHSCSKSIAMEDLGGLLAALARVSVHLVLSVSAVVTHGAALPWGQCTTRATSHASVHACKAHRSRHRASRID